MYYSVQKSRRRHSRNNYRLRTVYNLFLIFMGCHFVLVAIENSVYTLEVLATCFGLTEENDFLKRSSYVKLNSICTGYNSPHLC